MTTAAQRQYAALYAAFAKAVRYFKLSPEAAKVAWHSACQRPVSAAACYRAIARSIA